MAGYSGYAGYAKPSTPTPVVPLVPGIDPEHLNPTANPEFDNESPMWSLGDGSAPTLPDEYYSGDGDAVIINAGGGPVDLTPRSHEYGIGTGHGLTDTEAQVIRNYAGNLDMGDMEVQQYVAMTDREPGSGPGVAVIEDVPGMGDSPQTNALHITGVGGTDDVYARIGKRISRWWFRPWDMHRWEVGSRPMRYKTAYTAPNQPAVPDGTQYDSPFQTAAGGWAEMQPDSFVAPQLRRTPEPWDQPITSDATPMSVDDGNAAQLWGSGF